MKAINAYITEKFQVSKDNIRPYNYYPKTKEELRKILEERLVKDQNADLNDIDVSAITDMGSLKNGIGLFEGLDPHNIDISEWDVSNVTNMKDMFYGCNNFNSNLSEWDVSKVTDMRFMFHNCEKFNSDLSKWDVSSVTNMKEMFNRCYKFNYNLSKWDVSKVKDMRNMFIYCYSLINKPIWYKWYKG